MEDAWVTSFCSLLISSFRALFSAACERANCSSFDSFSILVCSAFNIELVASDFISAIELSKIDTFVAASCNSSRH